MNLTQKQWRKLLSVIQHLNDSLDDYLVRERAGRDLLDLLSADYFASFIWDEHGGVFSNPVYLNMSPENLKFYEQYYQFHDPITFKMQPFRRAVSVNEIMAQQDLINTEFFNDFSTGTGSTTGSTSTSTTTATATSAISTSGGRASVKTSTGGSWKSWT